MIVTMNPSATISAPSDTLPPGRLRSGTVARLAGLPVTTLRVWERRYGVVAAPKTATGHRQYSQHDVARLRLLKQLTDQGHAIGTVAVLPLEELQAMQTMQALSPGVPAATRHAGMSTWRVVAVGRSMAHKLSGIAACELLAVHDDLDSAEAHTLAQTSAQPAAAGTCDVLLVHLTSLQPAAAHRVMALGTALHVSQVLVIYAFGSDAVAEDLRVAGATVRREPVTGRDLGRLISAGHATHNPSADLARPPPRRFSDEDLAAIAEIPSAVACECPRHVAELVTQLAGFEQYSADCSSRTPADAALHRHLSHLAGAARARFEQALARIMAAEGLVLRGLG